jgi:hypothetical protein
MLLSWERNDTSEENGASDERIMNEIDNSTMID